MGNDPKSFVIFPDPLVNNGNITAITSSSSTTTGGAEEGSSAGPAPGAVTPSSSNRGNMIASHSGTLLSDGAVDLDYFITRAGGLYSNTGWAWKKGAETVYTGSSDLRFIHHHNDIFGDAGLADDTVGINNCIVASKKYSKIMAFRVKGTDTVEIASRTFDSQNTTWTSGSIDLSSTGTYRGRKSTPSPAGAVIAAVELQDGTILVFLEYEREKNINQAPDGFPATSGSGGDICIWSSKDGGTTWNLAADEILALYGGGVTGVTADLKCIKVGVDGDWIRMVTSENDGSSSPSKTMTLNTYVSSDRGATWKMLNEITTAAVGSTSDTHSSTIATDSNDLYSNYDVTGTGRGDGSFFLFYCTQSGGPPPNTVMQTRVASNDAQWGGATSIGHVWSSTASTPVTMYASQMASCAGASYIYVFLESSYSNGATPVDNYFDFIRGAAIPKDTYTDTSTWFSLGVDMGGTVNTTDPSTSTHSVRNYGFGFMNAVWAGNCVFMAHGLMNRISGGDCHPDAPYVGTMFGWFSKRPLRKYQAIYQDYYDKFFQQAYAVDMAQYPTSLTHSPWENRNLDPSINTAPSNVEGKETLMTLSASGQQGSAYYYVTTAFENNSPAFGTTNGSFMDHGVMGCVMKITNPNNLEATTFGTIVMAARTFSDANASAKKTMVGVGFDNNNRLIVSEGWQNVGGHGGWSALYTSPVDAIDWTNYQEVRLAIAYGKTASSPQCEVSFCKAGQYNEWHSSGVLTLDGSAPRAVFNNADFQPTTMLSKVYQTYYYGTLVSTAATSSLPSVGAFSIAWKSMYISEKEDMRQLGFRTPELVFGQPASPDPVYVHGGHYVTWGGGGAIYGDQYSSRVSFTYGVENAMAPSPNMVWKSPENPSDYAPTTTQDRYIVFDGEVEYGDGGGGARFLPDSVALYNTQTRLITVQWSNSSTFASTASNIEIDTRLHTDLSISIASTTSTGTSSVVKINSVYTSGGADYSFADHQLAGKFIQLQTAPNIGRTYKIIRNIGQYLYIDADSTSCAHITVGHTAIIYDNKAIGSVGSAPIDVYRYMRIFFSGSDASYGGCPKGQHSLGAIVIGEKFEMNVPFDWENSDSEASTVQLTNLSGGTVVANRLGPSRRSFTASIVGDMEQQTVNLKRCLRTLTDFNKKPVALLLDPDDLTSDDKQMYCRFKGSVDSKSLAWYRDADQVWRRTSEITLTFEEEV